MDVNYLDSRFLSFIISQVRGAACLLGLVQQVMSSRCEKEIHILYRVFLIIGPLRTIIGTARPYLAVPDAAPVVSSIHQNMY